MRKTTTILGTALLLLSPLAGLAAAAPASADPVATPPAEQDFGYTGGTQYFTVPAGVQQLSLLVAGAAGGDRAAHGGAACAYAPGGAGSLVIGALAVQPGEQLSIFV